MMKNTYWILFSILLFSLSSCSEDQLAGNPEESTLIHPNDAYLKVELGGGPLAYKQLLFKPSEEILTSRSWSTLHGDTMSIVYQAYVDSINNLAITTQPFLIRGKGVGSFNVIAENGEWGSLLITPLEGASDYDFECIELEFFDPKTTVTVWAFGTQPRSKVEVSFPADAHMRIQEKGKKEKVDVSDELVTVELVTVFSEE